MDFKIRISTLKKLYLETGHDYLLLVAHTTNFLSKIPAPKVINDTNLSVIEGLIDIYSKKESSDLFEHKFIDSIKENRDLIIHYLNWEQTNIIEKMLPSVPRFAMIHFSFQPWWKWHFSFSFNKKESRISEALKYYNEMKKVDIQFVFDRLPE